MRIAVVGYGTMGREVESVLAERGHQPVLVARGRPFPTGCTVGIDFTAPDAVAANVAAAMKAGARYVVGTTGWTDRIDEVRRIVSESSGGLVHAANFSVGVNVFYKMVRDAATLLARFPEYDPYVIERHHRRKKDAPSGTAKVLSGILAGSGGRRTRAVSSFDGSIPQDAFHVASVRAGGAIGDHVVGFDSGGEEIVLQHRAQTRKGFASGAIVAAEWIATRTGFHTFEDVLGDLSRA
jgi:4-hydroxy-tetrahydrodipicolinate reductase